jgi:hypothetical protein
LPFELLVLDEYEESDSDPPVDDELSRFLRCPEAVLLVGDACFFARLGIAIGDIAFLTTRARTGE